jgi:hypothetical protein
MLPSQEGPFFFIRPAKTSRDLQKKTHFIWMNDTGKRIWGFRRVIPAQFQHGRRGGDEKRDLVT